MRRNKSAFLFHEAGYSAHQVVFGEDLEVGFVHFHEDGRIFVAEDAGDAFDGGGFGDFGKRSAHDFADDQLAQIFALQREGQDLVFIDRADGRTVLEDGNLRNVLLLHGFERVKNGLIGTRDDELAHFPSLMFGVHDFRGGDGDGGVHIAALAHPFIVIHFAEIAHAGIRQKRYDEIFFTERLGEFKSGRDAAASAATGEDAFLFNQAPGDDEAFFVIDLQHVVENLHVHGGREEIFTDAFDHIGTRFGDLAGFVEVVIERAFGIDADDSDCGIFLFQIFADSANGAAGAHAANEVGDLAFAVFPDFRAGGLVVGFRVHRVVVLIGIKRIGNFTREFFGDGIITAGIFGFDSGGADNDFGAQGFEQIHFFLGLLVGDGENHLVAADGSNESKAHSGVAGSAFNDGAAGLEQAALFRVVNHGDADAVFHRAAGIDVISLDVDLGL